MLLGISGVGTAGARYTYAVKRRLDLDHWAWLVVQKSLPDKGEEKRTADVAKEAKWAHLITAIDNKEFDIYAFQMAIFSALVGVSLLGRHRCSGSCTERCLARSLPHC